MSFVIHHLINIAYQYIDYLVNIKRRSVRNHVKLEKNYVKVEGVAVIMVAAWYLWRDSEVTRRLLFVGNVMRNSGGGMVCDYFEDDRGGG